MLNAKLVVVGGDAQFDQIDLKLPTVIGRGNEADLFVSDDLISRRHAEITEENGKLVVRDLGSRNGTFVNNRKIKQAVLEPDQLLTLGTVTFRAIYLIDPAQNGTPLSASETLRIDFNETERLKLSAANQDSSRVPSDDLETVDMDDYLSQSASSNSSNSQPKETAYGGFSLQFEHAQALGAETESGELAKDALEYLSRRHPK